jgi:hypothetical protein
MRLFKTSLALLALFALMVPCVHAEDHDHAAEMPEWTAPACEHCETCSAEACSRPEQELQTNLTSPVDVPVRLVQQMAVLEHTVSAPSPAPRPPERLLLLQSVQLLI